MGELSTLPDHRKYWESTDFTITKTVLEEGERNEWQPRFGSTGTVDIEILEVTGIPQEELCSNRLLSKYLAECPSIQFSIGSADTEVDRQLERCIQACYPGQYAQFGMRVLLEPEYNSKMKVQENAEPEWISVEFKLRLESLLNAEPIFKWFNETKLTKARDFHGTGVKLFKEQRYLDAFYMFQHAYKLATLARGLEEDNFAGSKDAEELRILCYNNIAACHFQWNNYESVVELSDEVLKSNPDNVKTLYRRGTANMSLQEFDRAEKDLTRARKLEPKNSAVNEKLGLVQQRRKAAENKLANRMSKMFV